MGGLVVLLRVAMPPKERPGELLCFFGTKDPGRRTAITKCHAKGDFEARRRWMSLGNRNYFPITEVTLSL